jgi:hypothetical protein
MPAGKDLALLLGLTAISAYSPHPSSRRVSDATPAAIDGLTKAAANPASEEAAATLITVLARFSV